MGYDPDQISTRPVGMIAASLPGAGGVFRRFGIDYCCQGHVALADSVLHAGLDLNEVIAALGELDPDAEPEAPQETAALIAYIQSRYHEGHRRQLPELIALSGKVESVHVNHPNVPAGLARALQRFLSELDELMQQQEQIHFPAMQQKTPDQLALAIRSMRHDHNEHGFFVDRLDRLTDSCTPPEDACEAWRELYVGVAQFKTDLLEHIHLENNILFPRFEITATA